MKFFTIILSIYILVLSLSPCGDVVDCKDHANTKTEHTGDKHDHKTENCSPFCICACCGQVFSTASHNTDINSFSYTLSEKTLTKYRESFISTHYNNIWQPPKIS